MSKEHRIIDDEFTSKEDIQANTHEDRRKFKKYLKQEKQGQGKKVPIWVKKVTLEYEQELKDLQVELLKMQQHVKEKNLKMLIIFEGRDAAGKGGTIKRVTEHLNPRGARIVALAKPSDVENSQWYFQRYVYRLPNPGEIVLFDRSWYNRAVVEPVNGFCSQDEYHRFMNEVNLFEQMLTNSGIILIKFYLSIDKEEQSKRFKQLRNDPLKRWKMSPVDEEAQSRWDDYTVYKEKMFNETHSDQNPWVIIEANKKIRARIQVIKYILERVPITVDH